MCQCFWLGVLWNCLSDKIYISYTNVDIIDKFVQNEHIKPQSTRYNHMLSHVSSFYM